MSKKHNNNSEHENDNRAVCCPKCGIGLELTEAGSLPEHKVMKSLQGSKARICKMSGAVMV